MKKTILAAVLLLSACSVVSFDMSDSKPAINPHVTGTNDFFIGGIGQEKIIPVTETCRNGVSTVKTKYTFGDGVLAVITGGIYTPNTYEIYCNRPE